MENDQPIEPQTSVPAIKEEIKDPNFNANPTRFLLILILPSMIMLFVLLASATEPNRDVMLHGLEETEEATAEVASEATPEIEITAEPD